MSPAVRLATARDADAVASLLGEFRDWHGRSRPADGELRAGVERLIADPDAEFLLGAPEPRAPARGVCQLRFRYGLWHCAYDCWLEDLYVGAGAREAGLGTALVEAAIGRAERRGCRRIDLDATSDNEAALALYDRLGFSAAAGPGAQMLLLRRLLDTGS